jgi:hypothetical protein
MNWARGLFRVWLLFSVLWFASVGYFASKVFGVPLPFYGNYQHMAQIKEMPWKRRAWKREISRELCDA